jgi:hypothetical protein
MYRSPVLRIREAGLLRSENAASLLDYLRPVEQLVLAGYARGIPTMGFESEGPILCSCPDSAAHNPRHLPSAGQNRGSLHLYCLGRIPCATERAAANPAISPVCTHQGKFLITIKMVS